MRNRPSSNGEFPQKCVEVISTKAVAWSGQLAEDDALAILYMTVQPYCLWHLPWTMFWHGTSHNCPYNNWLLVCGTCQCNITRACCTCAVQWFAMFTLRLNSYYLQQVTLKCSP